jgi:toxin YoeB
MRPIFEKSYCRDLLKIKREDPAILKRIAELISSVCNNPRVGIGHPEQLKDMKPQIVWSRRITQKHRLVYEINDKDGCVIFTDCYGHYKDH